MIDLQQMIIPKTYEEAFLIMSKAELCLGIKRCRVFIAIIIHFHQSESTALSIMKKIKPTTQGAAQKWLSRILLYGSFCSSA